MRGLAAVVLRGVHWGIAALVLGIAVLVLVLPAVTGSRSLTVLTGSMRPVLPPGTLVVVRPVPVTDIRIGDVVTYQLEPGRPAVVTHRVVAVRSLSDGSRQFVTKGDANPAPDPAPVQAAQIKGRVWYSLPLMGALGLALGADRPLLLTLAGVGFLSYAAVLIVSGLRGRSRRRIRGRHAAPPLPRPVPGPIRHRAAGRTPRRRPARAEAQA